MTSVTANPDRSVRILAADPDAGQVWDPNLLVRADWDGDGIFDTGWEMFWNNPEQPYDMQTPFTSPGTRRIVIELRDTYFATSRVTQELAIP